MPNKIKTARQLHFFTALAYGWRPKKPRKKMPTQAEAMEVLGWTKLPKKKKRR